MICEHCGAHLPAGAGFCFRCGAPAATAKKVNVHKFHVTDLLSLLVLACAALLLVTGVVTANGFRTPEDAAKAYAKAVTSDDVEALISCYPDFYVDYLIDDYGVSNKTQLIRAMKEELWNSEPLSITVTKAKADYDYFDEYDLEDYKQDLKREYDLTESQLSMITKPCWVDLTYKINGETRTVNITCFRYGSRWYIAV